jgi:hypothetical protein
MSIDFELPLIRITVLLKQVNASGLPLMISYPIHHFTGVEVFSI